MKDLYKKQDAGRAYDEAVKRFHGEFGYLNFNQIT